MKMKSRLILAVVLTIMAYGLYRSLFPADKPAPPPPPPAQQEAQKQEPKQEKPQTKKRTVWPFHTGDYKVAVADDLLARNFVLIFDGSGSMNEVECSDGRVKIDVAKEAVLGWLQSVPAGANLGLVAFHSSQDKLTIEEISPGNRDKLKERVGQMMSGGSTPLASSFAAAYKLLEKQAQSQLGYGEYTIVVVTDGKADNAEVLTHNVNFILKHSPVDIYTIGFCIGPEHTLNQPRRTTYKTANNPAELRKGLEQVLAESENFDLKEF